MRKLADVLTKARRSVTYLAEKCVLQYTAEIDRLMAEREVTRAELGRRIGATPAYVTKVLRGETNLTVKTMVSLASALGAQVEIRVFEEGSHARDTEWQTIGAVDGRRPHITLSSINLDAANEQQWQTLQAA